MSLAAAARATRRASIALLALVASLGGCAVDATFKTVTFEGSDRGHAFEVSRDVVTRHYSGTKIRADQEKGKIETDPVEEQVGGKAMREQCYVDVHDGDNGRVVVEVMALMHRLEIDPTSKKQSPWKLVGSDVKVEGILLEEIAGQLLALEPDAKVVGSTLPKVAGTR